MADQKFDSPGNEYKLNDDTPPMKRPGMGYVWRLECDCAKEDIEVGTPHGAGIIRSIVDIVGGKVQGPKIKGTVLRGGADWATVIEGTHSITLDARYTVKTDDAHYIFVQAHGLYRPGPGTAYSQSELTRESLPPVVTQDDVEFFSHIKLEAGSGRYNWVNGLVCIGVMTCVGSRIVIDVYYLTNFPNRKPESILAKRADANMP